MLGYIWVIRFKNLVGVPCRLIIKLWCHQPKRWHMMRLQRLAKIYGLLGDWLQTAFVSVNLFFQSCRWLESFNHQLKKDIWECIRSNLVDARHVSNVVICDHHFAVPESISEKNNGTSMLHHYHAIMSLDCILLGTLLVGSKRKLK